MGPGVDCCNQSGDPRRKWDQMGEGEIKSIEEGLFCLQIDLKEP